MTQLQEFLQGDNYAHHLNIELLEVSNGYARAKMEVRDYHLNTHKTVHGGVIFSLADAVFAVASNSHGVAAVAINANISFIRATSSGLLLAEAIEQSLNPKLATYEVKVTAGDGELVAVFQGMVYRKSKRVDGKDDQKAG
ncbi:MAG TPA: hotdog fold thioesterase [Chloroflexia bacterium]|nr:hotdog fold thioesterase [Chloroflexia bacterium]